MATKLLLLPQMLPGCGPHDISKLGGNTFRQDSGGIGGLTSLYLRH